MRSMRSAQITPRNSIALNRRLSVDDRNAKKLERECRCQWGNNRVHTLGPPIKKLYQSWDEHAGTHRVYKLFEIRDVCRFEGKDRVNTERSDAIKVTSEA